MSLSKKKNEKKKKSLAASPAVRALLLQPRLVNAREAVIESRNLYALDPIWFEMMTMGHHHRKKQQPFRSVYGQCNNGGEGLLMDVSFKC